MTTTADDPLLVEISRDIARLRGSLEVAESKWSDEIGSTDGQNRTSAQNLVHYWAIRQYDLRDLQHRLAQYGLSSLGRSEPHVQATLERIAVAADALIGRPRPISAAVEFDESELLLRGRTARLFGTEPAGRQTRIMVTLPSEAATNAGLVQALVDRGMDLARINCAHDDAAAWAAMVANVRMAAATAGRECRIVMALAGPKLRTGPLADGPAVVRLHPTRDVLGYVHEPARCWLGAEGEELPPEAAHLPALPLPADWLRRRTVGETIICRDARGAERRFAVEATAPSGITAWTAHTAYLVPGTIFEASDGGRAAVGALPPTERAPVVRRGDILVLTRDCTPSAVEPNGPVTIGCTLPMVFERVRQGHAVLIDDGRISGKVLEFDHDSITVLVTGAAASGSRLRGGKGINLPDTVLPLPALTDSDRETLHFVAANADIVEASFVRGPTDVTDLLSALDDLGADDLGLVVKIETAQGFNNLPAILLAVLRRPAAGVMIARGDLAVECGYARLAELQEEILWLCEAAHLPVIWATQVLDQLARTGSPSRAEITDAAMGERAECVMLNKGPHIVDAVGTLDNILSRMGEHHYKKTALMRPLHSWHTAPRRNGVTAAT